MFSNFLDVLQGPSVEATDEKGSEISSDEGVVDEKILEDGGGARAAAAVAPESKVFDFWGVANALADTVKKTTADISASVGETDWRAEIEAFGKGVREDASEVQKHAQKAARDGASKLEQLPQQAANARLPSVDPTKVKTQLDQVGSRIGRLGTQVLSSSKDLFEQVAEAVQNELDNLEGHVRKPAPNRRGASDGRQAQRDAPKYSRLEADISAMQRSSSTYCDEPADTADYQAWLEGFELDSRAEDIIETITQENTFMAELQSRIVPLIVQYQVFWTRYFYQLHKLKQKHEQMQSLVQRVASSTEEVAWDDEEGSSPTAPQQSEPGNQVWVGRDASPAVLDPIKPKLHALAKVSGGEEEAETSTASDDSGNGPWTVVTSPSHRRHDSVEATSRPLPVPEEPLEGEEDTAAAAPREVAQDSTPAATNPPSVRGDKGSAQGEDEESDIDLSDEVGSQAAAEGKSDVEEDWGLWD